MTQYVINIGTIPNDGTGDPLRTAFNEVNLNFDQVFAAGPVLSNIRIANNTILTTNTNGNIVLAPNGIGVVQSNVSILPNTANIRNLGSANQRWNTVYTQYLDVSANLTISGNIIYNGDLNVAGNLTVNGDLIEVGNIVTDSKTIQLANTAGNTATANGSGITVGANDLIATYLFNSTANAWTTNIGISAVGNIAAPYFLGNGSQLTGVRADTLVGNTLSSNVLFSSLTSVGTLTNLNVTGNVSASANVIGGNITTAGLITATGNIIGGNFITSGNGGAIFGTGNITAGNILTGGLISATGNITAGNVGITGSSLTWANASIIQTSATDVSITGDGQVTIRSLDGTYQWTFDDAGNLTAPGNIGTSANVAANYFIGDGSQLTGIGASYTNADVANLLAAFGSNVINSTANITTTANVSAAYVLGDGSQLTNLPVQPGTYGDSNVVSLLGAFGSNNISTTGNVTAGFVLGNGSALTSITGANVTGTVANATYTTSAGSATTATSATTAGTVTTAAQPNITSVGTLTSVTSSGNIVTSSGNIQGGNLLTTGEVSATGNITGNYFVGNGSQLTGMYGDANVAAYLPTYSGNISGGNIGVTGAISAVGNVTGAYILGNGSQLTGVTSNYGDSNVTTLLSGFGSNVLSTTGNVTSGNLVTSGIVSATGNISTTGNVNSANVNTSRMVIGNIGGSSISADGRIFTPGNIVAGNVNSNGVLFATGNIVGANVNATGNINAGNVNATNLLFSAGNIVGANFDTSGLITALGNITGNYFIGNGSQLTGIVVSGGTSIDNGTSNVAIPTANGNVTVTANGTYTWSFGADGNLSAPGNISAVGNITGAYILGNGSQLTGLPATYGNANVANYLPTFSGNISAGNVSAVGNVTGNYFNGNIQGTIGDILNVGTTNLTVTNISAPNPGNVINIGAGGNNNLVVSNVLVQVQNVPLSVAGNVTGGNILTAGIVSATGNISGNYFIGNGSQLTGISGGVQSSIANGTSNVNIATANGNATITANAVTYTFGTNSTLTLPGGSQIRPLGANLDIIAGTGSYVNLTTSDESSSVGVDNGGGYIVTAGGTWDFGTTGNLTAPGNVSVVGNVTSANVNANRMVLGNIGGSSISADGRIFTSGNIVAGNINSNGVLFSTGNIVGPNFNVTGNVVAGNVNSSGIFFATGNITTVGNVIASGNIIGADATFSGNVTANNLSLAGNVTSNIGFTGTTITINNAPGGNEGAEIFWALPSPANTVLNTSLVQDVFQNGMRFFEAGGNNRGLYMDLGNVPNGSTTAVGYRDIPQISFTGNTTIATTDAGRHYYSTLSTGNVLTIANNASQGFQVGAAISIVNQGTGNITVAQGSGVTLYLAGNATSGNRTVATFGMATLIKVATDTWFINGTGVT